MALALYRNWERIQESGHSESILKFYSSEFCLRMGSPVCYLYLIPCLLAAVSVRGIVGLGEKSCLILRSHYLINVLLQYQYSQLFNSASGNSSFPEISFLNTQRRWGRGRGSAVGTASVQHYDWFSPKGSQKTLDSVVQEIHEQRLHGGQATALLYHSGLVLKCWSGARAFLPLLWGSTSITWLLPGTVERRLTLLRVLVQVGPHIPSQLLEC